MINVLGHLHPDSDAVCTAYMACRWLTLRSLQAQAWRCGEINRETRFIFEQAALPVPDLLTDSLADRDVWLVDFTEPTQGPASLAESNVVGIIDHHRLGGLVTRLPPEVWVKPVGSSSTLLWQLMTPEIRRMITPAEALLMLGAVISDTVALRSPTTTSDDTLAVEELSTLAGIEKDAFIAGLLTAKTSIEGLSGKALLNKDIKTFQIQGVKVNAAQIELFSLNQVDAVLDELQEEMALKIQETGAQLVVVMLTDINAGYSTLYFAVPEGHEVLSPCKVDGMLSRKKQLLPWLENYLAKGK
ncbi:inorganic pyrophosphatase/exopolyphosphatase [Enterobacteriaceae bacterium strain FGI 57]|nr:inorganic pyrophosphatase/exopolyphosphatase [Enterobacteriaceae bacterium strain FGI 57]